MMDMYVGLGRAGLYCSSFKLGRIKFPPELLKS